MIIKIRGHVPAKKDNLRPRRGGLYNDPAVQAEINGIVLQIKGQWRLPPLEETAFLRLVVTVPDGRTDLDSKYVTIQDCLVVAGVVKNDSIARINAFSAEARIDPTAEEGCEVQVY